MITFPTVKRTDVTAAPIQTSRHGTVVSGTNLKISANKRVMVQNENTRFIDSKRTSDLGSELLMYFSAAERDAVTTRELSRRKPLAKTKTNDNNRCLIISLQKLLVLLSTFQ